MKELSLPVFPWDTLADAQKRASAHPDGLVDLSVGSPVDTVPDIAREALEENWDAHFYPTVIGTLDVREAIVDWCQRERSISCVDVDNCLPTIGSKEMVANLGWQLGLEKGDKVLYPHIAYPTYDICARVAGATPVPVDMDDLDSWPTDATMVWLNTPSNPTGHVLDVEQLRAIVLWARRHDVIVASDECYAPITFSQPWLSSPVPSVLSDSVCEGDASNLLLVYSTSKQSNLAGYRASFIAGDPTLISRLIGVRKHCGYMAPTFTQAALAAVLRDSKHVDAQVELYRRRRAVLQPALEAVGLEIDPKCVAGLYLWARAGKDYRLGDKSDFEGERADAGHNMVDGLKIVNDLSHRGILVAPGDFYGASSREYVRIALSESDEKIASAAQRLLEIEIFS